MNRILCPLAIVVLLGACADESKPAPIFDVRSPDVGRDGPLADLTPDQRLPDQRHDVDQAKCSSIKTQHAQTLAAARVCDPTAGTVCTEVVNADLACPCNTLVDKTKPATVTQLKNFEAEWKSLGCNNISWGCPPVPCTPPTAATCQGSGTKGTCTPK
jgi:hypothetical protein